MVRGDALGPYWGIIGVSGVRVKHVHGGMTNGGLFLQFGKLQRTNSMLGKRLADARRRAGLLQADLAAELDYTQSVISRVEAGQRNLRSKAWIKVARLLNVSLDYLAGLIDDPAPIDRYAMAEGERPSKKKRKKDTKNQTKITPEEAVANLQLILEEPMLALYVKRGSLTIEDMADIADCIRIVRSEREEEGSRHGSHQKE